MKRTFFLNIVILYKILKQLLSKGGNNIYFVTYLFLTTFVVLNRVIFPEK